LQNDSKTITDYSKQRILNVVKAMEVYGGMKVQIIAYEDKDDSSQEEKELSKKRAQTVLDYMIKQGVDASRLSIATTETPKDKTAINAITGKPEVGKVEFVVVGYDK
jgi:outer membrane protein OmpA-like peptidoglycan-associated protein